MSYGSLLQQSITYQNPGSTRDKQGRVSLGSSSSTKVRFQRTHKVIKSENRDREPIHAVVFAPADEVIQLGAKITYDSTDYRVMTRDDIVDGTGAVRHREYMLQEWSYA